ncbi:MAG: DUF1080 domain-containing protein [Bryobacteraceae bacterium]|nr:DUF1080 domain-containing protein [Bryobacteraceae bacterium]
MTPITRRSLFGSLGLLLDAGAPDWIGVTGEPVPAFCWSREGDALHALAPRPAFQDLRTAEEVGDFEFEFEFRLAAGANSGVKYMIHRIDSWAQGASTGKQARARGFEFQLIDDNAEDALRDQTHVTGALYGIAAPSRRPPNAADGRYHAGSVVRRGALVRHSVDGQLLLEARLDAPEVQALCAKRKIPPYSELAAKKSPVALQHHNSEVWFRNLRLRVL